MSSYAENMANATTEYTLRDGKREKNEQEERKERPPCLCRDDETTKEECVEMKSSPCVGREMWYNRRLYKMIAIAREIKSREVFFGRSCLLSVRYRREGIYPERRRCA